MPWLTEGHKSSVSPPGLPGAPAALGAWHHPSGSSGVTPHQTRHLQQGWLRLGMRILESDLEYQEEILLSLFSLNMCLLDSGQCPKGVCCPWVCYLQKERRFSQPEQGTSPSHIHLSVCQPLNLWEMLFILFPGTVVDSSCPERTGCREEGEGDNLTIVSRDLKTLF